MSWQPPPRESWVEKLAAFGRGLGDARRSVVSLRPEDLWPPLLSERDSTISATRGLKSLSSDCVARLDEEAQSASAVACASGSNSRPWRRTGCAWSICGGASRASPKRRGVGPSSSRDSAGRTPPSCTSCSPSIRPTGRLLWEMLHTVPPPTTDDQSSRLVRAHSATGPRPGWPRCTPGCSMRTAKCCRPPARCSRAFR